MVIEHVFAGIPVRDRDDAVAFYERVFDGPPGLIPNQREAAWELRAGAWVYVEEDAERAGSALHTLLVDELDGLLARISRHGIEAGPVEQVAAGTRQAVVTDPDGNRLKVAQVSDG